MIKVGDYVRVSDGGYHWKDYDPKEWFKVTDVRDGYVEIYMKGKPGFESVDNYLFEYSSIIECKRKFKVGDTVRIRSWESMEEEFGLNDEGDIQAYLLFTTGMRHLEGRVFVIKDIVDERVYGLVYGLDEYWDISTDMIEHVDDVTAKIKNIIKQLEELL